MSAGSRPSIGPHFTWGGSCDSPGSMVAKVSKPTLVCKAGPSIELGGWKRWRWLESYPDRGKRAR
jgi:hypothetical protein